MKIGITGCEGRVGTLLVEELQSGRWAGASLAGGTVRSAPLNDPGFFTTEDPDELFKHADAIIDFTAPDATRKHLWMAAKHKKILVIGTTGLSKEDELEMQDAAKETQIIYAANFSVGVNVLLALVEQAAARLTDGWDIEVFESHHKHKVDAPSGTALAIGKAAANGREKDIEDIADYARHGETGARKDEQIGFSVARGGDVIGDHTAYFYGEGERLELTHRSTDRSLYAKGAIRAALWADDQKAGLYSMRDVLGL